MNLCDKKHEQICFDGYDCPMCEKNNETDRLEREIEELRDKVEDLELAESRWNSER
jgi:hypothetical protein